MRLRAVQCYKYLHHVQPLTVMSRKGETMSAKWRASQFRPGLCGGPLDRSVQVLMLALLMYLHSRRQSHCSEPCRELLLCCQHSYKHNDIVCSWINAQALTLRSAGLRWQYLRCR